MTRLALTSLFALALALGACTKHEQAKTDADLKAVGHDIAAGARTAAADTGHEVHKAGDQLQHLGSDTKHHASKPSHDDN